MDSLVSLSSSNSACEGNTVVGDNSINSIRFFSSLDNVGGKDGKADTMNNEGKCEVEAEYEFRLDVDF